jgi:hypothetical protein
MADRNHRRRRRSAPGQIEPLVETASEDELFEYVRDCCAVGGWMMYHTHDSRHSASGFPDVTAVHAGMGRLVFAELKSQRGVVPETQRAWLDALGETGCAECVHDLRRPRDADAILECLVGHRIHRDGPGGPYASRDNEPGG